MGSGGIGALEFILDMGRRAKGFLQAIGPHHRGGAVHFIEVPDFLRDLNIGLGLIELLRDQAVAEHRSQVRGLTWFKRIRAQKGSRLIDHIRTKVKPIFRHLLQYASPGLRRVRRRRDHVRAVGFHHRLAIRLLLAGHLDHINIQVHAEVSAGHGKRGAPLAGSCFRSQLADALLFRVVYLGDR